MPPSCVDGRFGRPDAAGEVQVETSFFLGRILARILGLPRSGSARVRYQVTTVGGADRWQRSFGGRNFTTKVRRNADTIMESVGRVSVEFALDDHPSAVSTAGARMVHAELRAMRIGSRRISTRRWMRLVVDSGTAADGSLLIDVAVGRWPKTTWLRYWGSLR